MHAVSCFAFLVSSRLLWSEQWSSLSNVMFRISSVMFRISSAASSWLYFTCTRLQPVGIIFHQRPSNGWLCSDKDMPHCVLLVGVISRVAIENPQFSIHNPLLFIINHLFNFSLTPCYQFILQFTSHLLLLSLVFLSFWFDFYNSNLKFS